MIEYLLTGITLGFIAGISPGPLLVLVITQTIKHNRKEGIKIALVPILSDLPIVLFSIFIIHKLSNSEYILGVISFLGAIFLIYLAWSNIRTKPIVVSSKTKKTNTLKKGIIANLLSPHPYLFWIMVGAPMCIKAYNLSLITAIFFGVGFYTFIVGAKIATAFLAQKSKDFLTNKSYIIIVKALGFILLLFAIILIKDGLEFFGIY